jgi:phosphate acetyltransferase
LPGEKDEIRSLIRKWHLKINPDQITLISPSDPVLRKKLEKSLYKLRKNKGLTIAQARRLLTSPAYFSTMCLQENLADGLISGAATSTAEVLKPALQIIKTTRGKTASGLFLILPAEITGTETAGTETPSVVPVSGHTAGPGPLLFADCAVNILPDRQQLCQIALSTAETAQMLGLKPRLAFLSFSSHGSTKHELAEKMAGAARLVRTRRPGLPVDGELQADSALSPRVARFKTPASPLKGRANVLIFPNLEAANIGYKLVERLGGARALGTIVQGLKKPVNDLSRGCTTSDIVYLTAITVLQTGKTKITKTN